MTALSSILTLRVSRLAHQFELSFWTLAIQLMSRSNLVRDAIFHLYQHIQPLRDLRWQRRTLTLAGAGLSGGLLFGLFFTLAL